MTREGEGAPPTTYRTGRPAATDRESIALHELARRIRRAKTIVIVASIAASIVVGLLGYGLIQHLQFERFGAASVKANVVVGFAPPVIFALAFVGALCRWVARGLVPSLARELARRHDVDEAELREMARSFE